ncbi:MAG: pentapeptide repeat-containing protein, partial [Desulfovibrio sp.]|nr:pentapeptide repeat-containing protein [Desulfovibrio sp.]
AARRALRRDDALLARLVALGFEEKTPDNAWMGYAAEAREEKPEDWGLPSGPSFTMPAGLYVPRFDGKVLVALRIYPLSDRNAPDAELLRGPGADAAAVFLVPGSDTRPLSLPASCPDEAVCVAPEDLSALFAEQEAGDFCRIVVAPDPAALAAVPDLPPLLPAEGGLPLLVILPPGAQGKALFAPWAAACPAALPLYLPEGCPHVLTLAGQGKRLRPLLLDLLPPESARRHDFAGPLPPGDGPPQPFTLNLPLPSKEEIQGRIDTLINEIRAHFPDPQTMLSRESAKAKEQTIAVLQRMNAPGKAFAEVEAAFAGAARLKPPPGPVNIAEVFKQAVSRIEDLRAKMPAEPHPQGRAGLPAALAEAVKTMRGLGEQLAPLDKLHAEGAAKLAALGKGDLPEDVKAAFAAAGMDPNALKKPTREEVQAMSAAGRHLARKNLRGLDLSGLDFSGADLSHAVCTGTKFNGCIMRGTNFTFTVADGADFTGADLRGARFMQAVLQKAVLRKADCTSASMELTTFGACDAAGAVFDNADIKLCSFDKADLTGARFRETTLSLCAFGGTRAAGADFRKARAFKCLFRKTLLGGARFEDAVLHECLFQGASCAGLSFAGADLRKLRSDGDADFSGADFYGADLREASLRMSRFVGTDFYGACPADALFTQCDLSRARLDGLKATGCRFIKCDLSGADLSGTDLRNGALRKCRLTGAELAGAVLFAANLRNMVIGNTGFEGANLKLTELEGKEEELRRAAHRH